VTLEGEPNPDRLRKRSTYTRHHATQRALLDGKVRGEGDDKCYCLANKIKKNPYYAVVSATTKLTTLTIQITELDAVIARLAIEKLKGIDELKNFREYEQKREEEETKLLKAREIQLAGIKAQKGDIEKKLLKVKNERLLAKLDAEYTALETREKEIEEAPLPTANEKDQKRRKKRITYYKLLERLSQNCNDLDFTGQMTIIDALIDEVVLIPLASLFFIIEVHWYDGVLRYIYHRDQVANPPWPDEDKEELKAIYATASVEEILDAFPLRHWNSIKFQAHALGLRQATHQGTKPPFTPELKTRARYSVESWDIIRKYGIQEDDKVIEIECTTSDSSAR
jgi:hypothetical protein